jgi:uncharacterized membrane protein
MIAEEIAALTWLGAALLALCGLPLAWNAWRTPETTRGLSWVFLAMWWLGELSMFAGLLRVVSWHVLANYFGNVLLISCVCGVKFALPKGSVHV